MVSALFANRALNTCLTGSHLQLLAVLLLHTKQLLMHYGLGRGAVNLLFNLLYLSQQTMEGLVARNFS